jgi:hypothetical protein
VTDSFIACSSSVDELSVDRAGCAEMLTVRACGDHKNKIYDTLDFPLKSRPN